MDLKAVLKARNLTDEQIESLVTKPEYSGLLESFIQEAEQGKTAYQKAQEIEQNLKTWNETQVIPYVRAADEKVAKKEAELAATRAHMKALKDAGYDIPDSYLESSSSAVTPVPPKNDSPSLSAEDIDRRAMDIAKTNMSLVTLSNKHMKLTGDYLDLDGEYADFETNRRPKENLREYIARKYDHAGLEAKNRAEAEQKKLDEYAAKKVSEEKAKWSQANGSNPDTRNPRSSKFDEIIAQRTGQGATGANLWQSRTGREQATKARLEKYQVQ